MSTTLKHKGLEIRNPRFSLREIWLRSAPTLGFSRAAIDYVYKSLELTSPQDYAPDSICAHFYKTPKLSKKIGMPQRTITEAEAELINKSVIIKTCSERGSRKGIRQTDGQKKIKWAAGINFAPLIERFAELQKIASAVKLEELAMEACRLEISAIRSSLISAGNEDMAIEAYPRGRPTEVHCLSKLKDILQRLQDTELQVSEEACRQDSPTKTAETVRPNTLGEPNLKSCTEHKKQKQSRSDTAIPNLHDIATDEMNEAITYYSEFHCPNDAVSLACRDRCADIGIPNAQWVRTKTHYGIPTSALFVALIDRNHQRDPNDPYYAGKPDRCLSAMAKKYKNKMLNLHGLIKGSCKIEPTDPLKSRKSKATQLAMPDAPCEGRSAAPLPLNPNPATPKVTYIPRRFP